jgi:hypothetical protein
MMRHKWIHPLDQWLERVWARVPPHVASPHFFWFFGFICGTLFTTLLVAVLT